MAGGQVKLEDGASTGHYAGIQATDGFLTSDAIWILPETDGTDGQFLKTDGSFNLSWVDETTARLNADSTLQANLNSEITARFNADSTLQANLNSEITARVNAVAYGTYIATIVCGATTNTTTARYSRVGDMVTVWTRFQVLSNTDSATTMTLPVARNSNFPNSTAAWGHVTGNVLVTTAGYSYDASVQEVLGSTSSGWVYPVQNEQKVRIYHNSGKLNYYVNAVFTYLLTNWP